MKKIIKFLRLLFPVIVASLTVITYYIIPDSGKQKSTEYPYFVYTVVAAAAVYIIFGFISVFNKNLKKYLNDQAPFITGTVVFLMILNIITTKTKLLPILYFPSPDKVTGVQIKNS